MLQFGRHRAATTAVALLTALLCLALAGCKDTTTPPDDWGDLRTEPFLPKTQPADALCEGDWCWMHPSPFGYTVRELRTVGNEVYGVGGQALGGRGKPFIWGEEIEFVDIPSDILADGPQFDISIGEDGWLAVTAEATVYEFGPDGVQETYQLPDVYPVLIDGHSTSQFIVGTSDSGVFLRRGGELYHWETMESFINDDPIWPNGDVWRVVNSDEDEPPERDWLRAFPAPKDQQQDFTFELSPDWIGPNPSGPCAERGVWASIPERGLLRWDDSSSAWKYGPTHIKPGLTDYTCRDDGTLIVSSIQGGLYANSDGSWQRVRPDVDASFMSTTTTDGAIYAGGAGGTMVEISSSGVRHRGSDILGPELFEQSNVPWSIWVSPDETTAMVVTQNGVHEWTAEGTENVSSDVGRSSGGRPPFGPPTRYAIWGENEPKFAIKNNRVLRWTGESWKESPLTAGSDDRQVHLVAIGGQGPQDVLLATSRALFHYDGSSWSDISPDGTQVHEVIEEASEGAEDYELIVGDVMARAEGGYSVTVGPDIYTLEETDGSWSLKRSRTTPCKKAGTLYRTDDSDLWVYGSIQCIVRSTGEGWETFDVPSSIQPYWPDFVDPSEDVVYNAAASFVEQPDSDLPLVGTGHGLLKPTSDGNVEVLNRNGITGLAYLPDAEITVATTYRGILAKYH